MRANTDTKVSIITPVYNVDYILPETVRSVLGQTLQAFELLLIDDGSEDDSLRVAKHFAAQDARVRVFEQLNKGPGAARNFGLREARGDYILFLDSDDVLPSNSLALLYDAAIRFDADLVNGRSMRYDGERTWPVRMHEKYGVTRPGLKPLMDNTGLFYSIGPGAKLYKRELVAGQFFPEDIRFGEDQPFTAHAYLHAKRIYTVDGIVYYYRARLDENLSLTQMAKANPGEMFGDLFRMLDINDKQFNGYPKKLHYAYLQRVMMQEVFPILRAGLLTTDEDLQVNVLTQLTQWLERRNQDEFRFISAYTVHLYLLLRAHAHLIQRGAKPVFDRLVRDSKRKMGLRMHAVLLVVVGKKMWYKFRRIRSRLGSSFIRRVIYPIAKYLFPLRGNQVTFATNRSAELEGNLKAVYDGIARRQLPLDRVVITPHLKSYWQRCRDHIHLARSRVIFVDDYYRQLYKFNPRRGQDIVQLWHATGAFKKFGMSALGAGDSNTLQFELDAHKPYSKVVVSSKHIAQIYAEAFHKRVDQILATGVPRTDVFFDERLIADVRKRYLEEYPVLQGKKIILYAPTFRGNPTERRSFSMALDLNEMHDILGDDYIVIVKFHPIVRTRVSMNQNLKNFVLDLTSGSDINDLMMIADILVTDYSSVVFEYSLLQRPMYFFAYDLDSYLDERGFYYPYRDFVPGPIVKTTAELAEAIRTEAFDPGRVESFANYFFDDRDGRSTDRLLDTLFHRT